MGVNHFAHVAFACSSYSCFCHVGSSVGFVAVPLSGTILFTMTSHSTNNSSQSLFAESASVVAPVLQSTDVDIFAFSTRPDPSYGSSLSRRSWP